MEYRAIKLANRMNYVVGDIHNDSRKLKSLLKRIEFGENDHLFLLGDLFDRCGYDPDPVGVYFTVRAIKSQCSIVTGNHDRLLAEYIKKYYGTKERKRKLLPDYPYNSFEILRSRLTQVDMMALADWILSFPLQLEAEINGLKFLFAHAKTSDPSDTKDDEYYLTGDDVDDTFYAKGIDGYVTFIGHSGSGFLSRFGGEYVDEGFASIWRNDLKNVYMMDCGCGHATGKLACLCLEDMRRFYE